MMSVLEKQCIVEVLSSRYRHSRRSAKSQIISELCERISVGRKPAIRLLKGKSVGRPRNPLRIGRPGKYQDKAFRDALSRVWSKSPLSV